MREKEKETPEVQPSHPSGGRSPSAPFGTISLLTLTRSKLPALSWLWLHIPPLPQHPPQLQQELWDAFGNHSSSCALLGLCRL